MWLPPLKPIEPNTPEFPSMGSRAYIVTIKEMCKLATINLCSIAWASFYLLATVVLLVVMELGALLTSVDDQKVSYLTRTQLVFQ